ncbi:MAG: (2Fe-2S)-binding protein [Gammaproteobacteria bacterium]|jgi:aerobic carbon-monoxide dehydrogenase small subunit|nr:(2Fe-2S)-binding protein [Gammaproteobacteria bacterium]MBT5722996.1 (2Fe-2S)-binding protein [Gammaproteobacteria bacterium]MBT6893361.1 (2Fe-2S)-binding protein [Gammaproteobacteria bacterium]MBT7877084.1 (2Fe-2S)-binding protein [Gammaproteobacteria bacterium]MDG1232684.1 (2Fe-2S)-binding protein [Pseudomonadales bacterium]
MSISVQLNVNGKSVTLDCPSNTTLVDLLRERLELTGTHVGCDTTQCGACTVHLNGRAVKSCTILAAQCEGAEVTTIEGLGDTDNLHPMQEAFRECHGLQCGFCTPGMIMSAVDLVHREPAINEQVIREGLEGNICRCTGYHNIVLAVESAAKKMRN